eukprot:Sdes_comp20035_c0_seq2m12833
MGATNRPQELDEAVLRRLPKRIYVPLPDHATRCILLDHLLGKSSSLGSQDGFSHNDISYLAGILAGYSCSDIKNLAKEAALVPIRELGMAVKDIAAENVRPIRRQDVQVSMRNIRPSVSSESIHAFEEWNRMYGCTK